jgi:hypothetical protein
MQWCVMRTIRGIDCYYLALPTSKVDADNVGMSEGKVSQGLINLWTAV